MFQRPRGEKRGQNRAKMTKKGETFNQISQNHHKEERPERQKKSPAQTLDSCEVPPRLELGNKGFADLRLTTWLWHRMCGAVDGIRTRDIHLGKVALYH